MNGGADMDGYAIVKLTADALAEKEGIIQRFNSYYLHLAAHALSFVHGSEGYFRLSCGAVSQLPSSGIAAFEEFLQSSGYAIKGVHTAAQAGGYDSTDISFSMGEKEAHVTLSTIGIY